MEFAQQLFAMLDEEARARLVYKPSKAIKGRLMKRVIPMIETQGKERHRFSDIEFIVGEERTSFFGQKFIFATMSPWFEERLYGNGPCEQLEIPEVSEEVFQCIYNVTYGQEPPITAQNVLSVLEGARMMGVDFLAGECLGLLAQNVNGKNVLEIFSAAMEQKLLTAAFERRCCKIILKQANQVLNSPGFLTTNTELMIKLLECDFFKVDEVHLWNRLVLWAKNKAAEELESKHPDTPMGDESDFNVGDKVILVNGNVGTVSFKGEVEFGPGIWFGIDLRDAAGDTNGKIDGREYFSPSREDGGVFVRVSHIGAKVMEPEPEEEMEVFCVCGLPLTKTTAAAVGGGSAIKCTVSSKTLKDDDVVFTCPAGNVKAHPGGFQICQEVYDDRKEAQLKAGESLQPVSRDVQNLRKEIPFVRFPIMPLDFFTQHVSELLPRQMSDSVLLATLAPTRPCMFPTQERIDWNAAGGDGLEFTVIAAKCALEKAQNIPIEGVAAQWSGVTMNTHGNEQWFIIDCAAVVHLNSFDMKNHYDDGDTIKEMTIFALDPSREYSEDEHDSEHWILQTSLTTPKTKAWQRDVRIHTNIDSRYWKFSVTAVYGGEGNYTCMNELKLNGMKVEDEDDDDDDEDGEEEKVTLASYNVPAASHALPRAQAMNKAGTAAEWSHVKMSDAGKFQWFIFDLGSPQRIKKLEMQHRYSDNDTIKDFELYYLPVDHPFGNAEKQDEGGAWVKAGELLSRQTTELQSIDVNFEEDIKARFWRFKVLTVYGGGLDCNHYPCMNSFSVFVLQQMWTTGFCQE